MNPFTLALSNFINHTKEPEPGMEMRVCSECLTMFLPANHWAKTCSEECGKERKRKRERGRRAANRWNTGWIAGTKAMACLKKPNVKVSGPEAALSPEAPVDCRVGPGEQERMR